MLAAAALVGAQSYSLLAFHDVAEGITIALGCAVFVVAFQGLRLPANGFFLVVSCGFLSATVLRLAHTDAYRDIVSRGLLTADVPLRLALAMRLTLAVSFLLAPLVARRSLRAVTVGVPYAAWTVLVLGATYLARVEPAFVTASGSTAARQVAEGAVGALFVVAAALALRGSEGTGRGRRILLATALGMAAAASFLFAREDPPYTDHETFAAYYLTAGWFAIVLGVALHDCVTRPLARLRQVAAEASDAQARLIRALGHELRTPLTPALAAAEVLASRSDLPAQVKDDLRLIRRNIELEARLIDALLAARDGPPQSLQGTLGQFRAEVDQTAPPAARRAGAGARVLLVEDHPEAAAMLARLLRLAGHEVAVAGGLAAAVEAAQGRAFDVVVSDIDLPDGSGQDLLLRLGSRLPAIAISGSGTEEDARRSLAAGFTAHLVKPVDIDALDAALRKALADRISSL